MARLHRPRSTSFGDDHEPLLRDFQGQGNDRERQDEEISSAKNDWKSEDGGEKQENHIYPRWLAAGHSDEDHYEDTKPEHQDHHISSFCPGGAETILPCYLDSVPLPQIKVRCCVFVYKY